LRVCRGADAAIALKPYCCGAFSFGVNGARTFRGLAGRLER